MKPAALWFMTLLACAGCAVKQVPPPSPTPPTAAPAAPQVVVADLPAQAPDLPVLIAHVAPMTGPLWHLGRDNELGARLAVEELNARGVMIGKRRAQFSLVTRNDAGDPKRGVAVAEELVALGVKGVIGHLNSGTTIPASAVYHRAGIPQITPSATNPRYTLLGRRTSFRLIADDRQLGHAMGRYAVERLKGRRIAIVDDRTAYGEGIADEFAGGVEAAGGRIAVREPTHDREADFRRIVARLKTIQPDLVFYGGMDHQAGALLRDMASAGVQVPLLGGDGICTLDLVAFAGSAVRQDFIVCGESGLALGRTPQSRAFQAAFRKRFGIDAQLYAPFVYDAVMVMADAMARAGSAEPQHYLPLLATTRAHPGVTDTIGFLPDGNLASGWVMLYTYRNGRREVLEAVRAVGP